VRSEWTSPRKRIAAGVDTEDIARGVCIASARPSWQKRFNVAQVRDKSLFRNFAFLVTVCLWKEENLPKMWVPTCCVRGTFHLCLSSSRAQFFSKIFVVMSRRRR
jgi:hypothetical protein